jgi:hypothetical protein
VLAAAVVTVPAAEVAVLTTGPATALTVLVRPAAALVVAAWTVWVEVWTTPPTAEVTADVGAWTARVLVAATGALTTGAA